MFNLSQESITRCQNHLKVGFSYAEEAFVTAVIGARYFYDAQMIRRGKKPAVRVACRSPGNHPRLPFATPHSETSTPSGTPVQQPPPPSAHCLLCRCLTLCPALTTHRNSWTSWWLPWIALPPTLSDVSFQTKPSPQVNHSRPNPPLFSVFDPSRVRAVNE